MCLLSANALRFSFSAKAGDNYKQLVEHLTAKKVFVVLVLCYMPPPHNENTNNSNSCKLLIFPLNILLNILWFYRHLCCRW